MSAQVLGICDQDPTPHTEASCLHTNWTPISKEDAPAASEPEEYTGAGWVKTAIKSPAIEAPVEGAREQLISDVDAGCPNCNGVNRHHPNCSESDDQSFAVCQQRDVLLEALHMVIPYMEAREAAQLVGDEGCHWPVEIVRSALASCHAHSPEQIAEWHDNTRAQPSPEATAREDIEPLSLHRAQSIAAHLDWNESKGQLTALLVIEDVRKLLAALNQPSQHSLEAREWTAAKKVIEAARCVRHWHDAMKDGSGMVVSSEKVRLLWDALSDYDAIISLPAHLQRKKLKVASIKQAPNRRNRFGGTAMSAQVLGICDQDPTPHTEASCLHTNWTPAILFCTCGLVAGHATSCAPEYPPQSVPQQEPVELPPLEGCCQNATPNEINWRRQLRMEVPIEWLDERERQLRAALARVAELQQRCNVFYKGLENEEKESEFLHDEIEALEQKLERTTDLVRYQRHELFEAKLIPLGG